MRDALETIGVVLDGAHESKPGNAHVLHRADGGCDVDRVLWLVEDDDDGVEKHVNVGVLEIVHRKTKARQAIAVFAVAPQVDKLSGRATEHQLAATALTIGRL